MSKHIIISTMVIAALLSPAAHAAPGETWEVVTKTEIAGANYAIPELKETICQEKGKNNPVEAMKQEGDCKLTDIQTSGKKTTWKMHCDKGDSEMTGTGEITQSSNSYQGVAKLNGKADGKAMTMTAIYTGKRVGAACDTSAPRVVAIQGMENMNEIMGMAKAQMAAGMAEQCEVSRYDSKQLISNRFFGPNAACPDKEKFACKVIRKDVERKPEVLNMLVKHDDTSDTSISDICGIDLKAVSRTTCKKVDESNYQELEDACPDESAKIAASMDSGRSYTSSSRSPDAVGGVNTTIDKTQSTIDTAKKLKGLFGF